MFLKKKDRLSLLKKNSKNYTNDQLTINIVQIAKEDNAFSITKPLKEEYQGGLKDVRKKYIEDRDSVPEQTDSHSDQIKSNITNAKNLSTEKKEKAQLIVDNSKIYAESQILTFGTSINKHQCNVEIATIRGRGSLSAKKVANEDASSAGTLNIKIGEEDHQIIYMATMDGGGGHLLGQYAELHLESLLEFNLQQAIDNEQGEVLDRLPELLTKAIETTKNQMFNINLLQANGNKSIPDGEAWNILRKNREEFINEFDIEPREFKNFIRAITNKNMTPLQIYESIQNNQRVLLTSNNTSKLSIEGNILTINGKKFDLAKKEDAEILEDWLNRVISETDNFNLSAMPQIQMVISTVFIDNSKKPKCLTINYGDTSAVLFKQNHLLPITKETTNAVVSSNDVDKPPSATLIELNEEDTVSQFTDGVTDYMTENEMEEIMQQPEYEKLSAADKTKMMIQLASFQGGDDKTFSSLKLVKKA